MTPDENLPGENVTPDPLHPPYTHLRNIYFAVDPEYSGRFTVPTLYDNKTKRIVNNEVGNEPPFHLKYPVDIPWVNLYCMISNIISFREPTELRNHPHVLPRIRCPPAGEVSKD